MIFFKKKLTRKLKRKLKRRESLNEYFEIVKLIDYIPLMLPSAWQHEYINLRINNWHSRLYSSLAKLSLGLLDSARINRIKARAWAEFWRVVRIRHTSELTIRVDLIQTKLTNFVRGEPIRVYTNMSYLIYEQIIVFTNSSFIFWIETKSSLNEPIRTEFTNSLAHLIPLNLIAWIGDKSSTINQEKKKKTKQKQKRHCY
jgi:hypothetical protein